MLSCAALPPTVRRDADAAVERWRLCGPGEPKREPDEEHLRAVPLVRSDAAEHSLPADYGPCSREEVNAWSDRSRWELMQTEVRMFRPKLLPLDRERSERLYLPSAVLIRPP